MPTMAQFSRWSIEIVRTAIILAIVLAVGAVYQARGDNHESTYWACLYAGSLSQVGPTEPANCGRGEKISWNSQGVQGTPGVSGYAASLSSVISGAAATAASTVTLTCADGRVPVGSGYAISGDDREAVVITGDRAVARSATNNPFNLPLAADPIGMFDDFGWEFRIRNTAAPNGGGFIGEFSAYCVDVELPEPV